MGLDHVSFSSVFLMNRTGNVCSLIHKSYATPVLIKGFLGGSGLNTLVFVPHRFCFSNIFERKISPRQGREQMTCRKPWTEEKLMNTVCLDQHEHVKRKLLMCVHKDGRSVFIQILTGEPCKHVDCGRPSVPSDVQLFSNLPSSRS